MSADRGDFAPIAERLIGWHARHGRRHLPWQRDPTPYRVWVSEIMLQQTQVSVVIGYYERFMARFPEIEALAGATLDDVLGLWTGLGYYSRARNLHLAAVFVRDRHGGAMPRDLDALVALPGIGRSTAGAILALSHGDRHPILDGNVKRVLCRYHGIRGWPGQSRVERTLWALAERHTPREHVATYTQAIMDLGATLCARSRPLCSICPIGIDCVARRDGTQARLPAPPTPARDASASDRIPGAARFERCPASGAPAAERDLGRALVLSGVRPPPPTSKPPAGIDSVSVRPLSLRLPRSHTDSRTSSSTCIPSSSRSTATAPTRSPSRANVAGIRPAPPRAWGSRRR